jgi:ribosome-binding factor A
MASHRIEQVNELIRSELAHIILRELEFPIGCLVTLIKVETASDLKTAKVFFSVLPTSYLDKAMKVLHKNHGRLQGFLGSRLKMQFIPKMEFKIDLSLEKAAHINELLEEVKKEKEC